jgi:crotonobetainyl-CoA:carnitine CoA-transferase CaiB-like acyl-CoA transferase
VCEVAGRPELKKDERFSTVAKRHKEDNNITALLQPVFRTRPAAEWISEFEKAGVPCAPVYDFAQVCEDPHVKASGQIAEVALPGGRRVPTVGNALRITGCAFEVRHNPPRLAEHQDEVFREWLA